MGQVLAGCRLVRALGSGGMGSVYLAEHEVLEGKRAVKLLHPDLSRDPEVVQRFVNEAKAANRIRHPGIVQIFDFGTHQSGRGFIVMEFLEGESLAARLEREGELPPDTICAIGAQMADALAAAHAAGIVHRDLKPDNVFLVPDAAIPEGVRVKVLDFGIAKLGGDAHLAAVQTRTGVVMGTPHYMSPEQCRGSGDVDPRSDIYSLGCLLFQMACRQPPFPGEGLGEVLAAHQYVAPPSPGTLSRSLPPAAESFLLRLLAKRPEDRPQTMQEVKTGLSAFAGGDAGRTGAPSTLSAEGAGEVSERRRGRSRLLLGGFAALAAAGAIYFAQRGPGPGEPQASTGSAPGTSASRGLPGGERARTAEDGGAAAERVNANRWIQIEPPPGKVRLGLRPGAGAREAGFWPELDVRAPAAAYWIQQHEVTWGEIERWLNERGLDSVHPPSWIPQDPEQRRRYPATGLSWALARDYCRYLGGDLPTEEEWEYAARGPERRPHPWGDAPLERRRTRAGTPSGSPLSPVATSSQDRTPGPPGRAIYDLAGNAREWTADFFRDGRTGDDSWSREEPKRFYAVRGLDPDEPVSKPPRETSAHRAALCQGEGCGRVAAEKIKYIGFRCVKRSGGR